MNRIVVALVLLATLITIPQTFAGTGTVIISGIPPTIMPPILYDGTAMPHAVDVATPTFRLIKATVSELAAGKNLCDLASWEYRFTYGSTPWVLTQNLETRLGIDGSE